MAYERSYGGQVINGADSQRPYAGTAAQRPSPRAYHDRPMPTRHHAPPPPGHGQNDGYDYGHAYSYDNSNGYRYDDYAPNYSPPYAEHERPRRGHPPPHDYGGYNAARGDRRMPAGGGRGAPIPRPAIADGYRPHQHAPRGRGMGPGPMRGMPGAGRGARPPGRYPPQPDRGDYIFPSSFCSADLECPSAGRRPPMSNKPPHHHDRRYDDAFDYQLAGPMSDLSLQGQRARPHPPRDMTGDGYSPRDEYAPHAGPAGGSRGYEPRSSPGHAHADPRQRPPAHPAPSGYEDYGDDYGGDYGGGYAAASARPYAARNPPPERSMTMPAAESSPRHLPKRAGTMPYEDDPGRGMPPGSSPTTANRPSPRGGQFHRPAPRAQDSPYGGGGRDTGQGRDDAPVEDYFDTYYDAVPGHAQYDRGPELDTAGYPNFSPTHNTERQLGSFDQTMRPGSDQYEAASRREPRLHHARSETHLPNPQASAVDMGAAPYVPSVPPPPRHWHSDYTTGPAGREDHSPEALPPRGPSAPPATVSHAALPPRRAPVRPGLMNNASASTSGLSERPPPVRNYGNVPQGGPAQAPNPSWQQQQHQQHGPGQPHRIITRVGHQNADDQQPPAEEAVTMAELEQLRQIIKSDPNDQESAFKLAKKLIEAGDVLAPKLPEAKQRTRARERYLFDAHKILKKLAQVGNREAMFLLADCLGRRALGQEPDIKEAFTLYQSAAKLGHAAAAYRTAVCCEIGHEEGGATRRDPLKATQWYKRAASLGDTPAMYKMGMILLKGLLGQPKSPGEAVSWLKRAAQQADAENPHALHELGLLHASARPNDLILRDEGYALSLFQQAAELGYKFSQFQLGCVFEHGRLGAAADARQSLYWYAKAAAQGEHQAELALSGWYLTGGEGVLGQSDTEAYLWARKAALAALAKAEYAMGYFTETGIGTPANLEDAKRWYWRAAAQDFPQARERLEDLKRRGAYGGARARERISRSRIEKAQDGDCGIM